MIQILCPTDFSDHSRKALDFALNLAATIDAEVHLLTIFKEHRGSGAMKSVKRYIQERNEADLDQLEKELLEVFNFKNTIHKAVLEGYTVESINYYAKSMNIDLIVIGTQGRESIQNRLFGSTTNKLVQHTKIPVLAIPFNTRYQFSQGHFLFPVDSKAVYNNKGFELLNLICDKLDKKVDLLHIKKKGDDEEYPFDPFISEYLSGHIAEVILDDADDAISYIEKYTEQHPVEMLVMIRREHSFLNRVFYRSNTDKELADTKVPLLIIPDS